MAFAWLNNLRDLGLNDNLIGQGPISQRAFTWYNESSDTLRLDLGENPLDVKFFDELVIEGKVGSQQLFTGFHRPVELVLDGVRMRYLPEAVFKPFLEANSKNKISIASTSSRYLNCYECRNFWIFEKANRSSDETKDQEPKFKYESRINVKKSYDDHGVCEDTIEPFWQLDLAKFQYCFH